MKKLYTLLLVAFMVHIAQAQIITIPDANFKAKLLLASPTNQIASNGLVNIKIDTNNNNEIEVNEALQVIGLNVSISEIYNLTGVESFANLRTLNCSQNHIPSLDLSTFSNLKSLYCSLNVLTSLNLTGSTHLLNLECSENTLTQINFADASGLQTLSCRFNFLTSLEVNGLTNLQYLNCDYNQLTALNISNLTKLTDLGCQTNQIQTLNASSLVNLTSLNCSYNQLTALDVTTLNNLTTLNCSHNQIASLEVSGLTQLSLLNCESNHLSNAFVFNGMPDLQSAYCQNNLIPSFTFSDLPNLQILNCSANQISTLDVSGLPSLSLLNCHDNPQLVYLNIKNGSDEQFLDFSNTPALLNVCVDDAQLIAVQNLITQYGYINCQANSTCNLGSLAIGASAHFGVYPNPAKDTLLIETKEVLTIVSATIYNTCGQLVLINTSPHKTIDVSGLQPGTYIIKIQSNKGSRIEKFVKE